MEKLLTLFDENALSLLRNRMSEADYKRFAYLGGQPLDLKKTVTSELDHLTSLACSA